MDLQEAFDQGFDALKGYVDRTFSSFERRIKALEARELQRGEKGEPGERGDPGKDGGPGEPGRDGKDADPAVIKAMVEDAVAAAIAAIPAPQSGKDADPEVIAEMVRAEVAKLPPAKDGESVDPATIKAMVDDAVAALPKPVDGKDADMDELRAHVEALVAAFPVPKDGQSVTVADVEPLIAETVRKAVDALPVPKDGAPGKDGRDGLDAVEFLRGAGGHLICTLSNGTTRDLGEIEGKDGAAGRDGTDGKDGLPGKDGLDGVGFDDMDLVETDAGIMLRFVKGENVKEFRLPVIIDRGVFKEGQTYRRGDGVTWGGSFWIAQEETTDKPDSGKGFRLAVKRGRDGKDGQMKPAPEQKPVKVG